MKKELNLGKDKIGSLLLAFSVPCIISMLINSIYNIVDQIFIGQGVGYLGNAATNVRTQPVRPYDGDDMINVPIDQSVLYGVWKNDDIKAVIEVSGDKPHMIVTENGKLIFEGDVRLP